jgi:hypothetical protein
MTELTRRRDQTRAQECWLIYYGDVHVGTISAHTGGPRDEAKWDWSCGFYPGNEPGEHRSGSAATFDRAHADFENAWQILLSRRSKADFQAWRDAQAFTAWKYAMWDAAAKLPTQMTAGKARCLCGAEIDVASVVSHLRGVHPFQAL